LPIQILPARLANQIAAGEVVERPASVVKELVENSLDSGATSIEIEIEKGGHKGILIRDNGSGIAHEELALALSRHATSKITHLDDLEAICSLGFRGEALASISSVSRLSLSSKPKTQNQAWQAHCEGRDMQVQINPVAHPDGTTVDVVDLFFNTPARRKFLKTEKTEFGHIDEVIRRIALSRFDVSFSLKHNGKLLRKYPAAQTKDKQIKRLTAICGKDTANYTIELNSQYQQFTLQGWLVTPGQAKAHADFQYFYVNGRMMRDKLINHAVRQAFEGLIEADVYPSYVLYLTLEPNQVDVNVHPAKHEVRFHQARLVHDFIYRALTDSLNQYFEAKSESTSQNIGLSVLPPVEPKHEYIQPLQQITPGQNISEETTNYANSAGNKSAYANKGLAQHLVNSSQVMGQTSKNYQQLMTPSLLNDTHKPTNQSTALPGQWLDLGNGNILVNAGQSRYLVKTSALHLNVLTQLYVDSMPVSQPLLMPISITANANLLEQAKALYQPLLDSSVEIGWTPNRIILRKVPAGLRHFRWIEAFETILNCLQTSTQEVRKHLLTCIVAHEIMDLSQVQHYWQQFVIGSNNLEHDVAKIGTLIDLNEWLNDHE
jgi:DNA mismatch repair protein MutL